MTWWRNRWLWAGSVALLVAGLGLFGTVLDAPTAKDTPTFHLSRGAFHLTLFENGEIQAAGGEQVRTPEVGGRLKIVQLWPEGEQVEVGDMIVQFDKAEFEQSLRSAEGELQRAQADLSRGQASQEQALDDIKTSIAQQEAGLELAKLKLKQQEYGTPNDKEEAKINLQQAERALEQAKKDYEVRKLVNRVDLAKIQLNITQAQKNFDRIKADYDRLDVRAARPGIVVYEKIRKSRGVQEKVKVGDTPWGGQVLVTLPDLAAMQVVSQVGEMDLQQVRPGQPVLVRLDAFPGPVFHGQIAKISPLANPMPEAENVQIFELTVDLDEQDVRLKPGMSASVEIIVDTIDQVLSVPLEAVREEEGRTMVYRLQGKNFKPVAVKLGQRNAVAAVVDSGLEEGAVLALQPPALKEE